MFLENTYVEEIRDIQKSIKYAYLMLTKKDPSLYLKGVFDITPIFDSYEDIIKKENIKIKLAYDFTKKNRSAKILAFNKSKEIIIVLTGENFIDLYRNSLYHELVHVIDLLRSGFKQKKESKEYKKIAEKAVEQEDSRILKKGELFHYLNDELEFNAFINTIKKMYEKNKIFKIQFNFSKNYEKMLTLILNRLNLPAEKSLLDNKEFKKKLLKRLSREGILPKLF